MATGTVMVADLLRQCVHEALRSAGADEASAQAATRAMMHASCLGVDSHGVRLTPHYCAALRGGRLKGTPALSFMRMGPAAGMVDGDDGLGHLAAYAAMEHACDMARENGISAIGIRRSSHVGAAGAYALAGAQAGMISIFVTNSDSGVLPFDGTSAFHGTNPIAAAAPVEGSKPWLLDMATSSIPFNRILLYRDLGLPLPEDVAVDSDGVATVDAARATALLPLGGGAFGFKGAGLAGLVTILSAILTDAGVDDQLLPMAGPPDRPRNLGQFAIAIDPAMFPGGRDFGRTLAAYLDRLRSSPTRHAGQVMAPGDREWI